MAPRPKRQIVGQQQFDFDQPGERMATEAPPGLEDPALNPVHESRPGQWLPFSSSRVSQGRYDSGLQQVHVVFKDGTPWVYDGVPKNVWRNFRRSASPGRFINRTLNDFSYWRGSFDRGGMGEDIG
jgi:hypothetical protein